MIHIIRLAKRCNCGHRLLLKENQNTGEVILACENCDFTQKGSKEELINNALNIEDNT